MRKDTLVGKRTCFAFILAAGIIVVLLLEGAARLYVRYIASLPVRASYAFSFDDDLPGIRPRYIPHPYLTYALQPKFQDVTGKTHHNSLGFRGGELSGDTSRLYRIIAVGGSTTYTTRVEDDTRTYPFLLDSLLSVSIPDQQIEVINAGVGGYTSWESFINLAFRLTDLKPDMILIYDGVNDLHCRIPEEYNGENTGYRHPWQERLSFREKLVKHSYAARVVAKSMNRLKPLGIEHYTTLDPDLKESPDTALLKRNPPVYFERNLRHMIRLSKAYGIAVVLCTFAANPAFGDHYASTEYYREGLKEMNEVIKSLSVQEMVPLVDLDSLMDRRTGLWADGVHVNAEGAFMMAEIISGSIIDDHIIK